MMLRMSVVILGVGLLAQPLLAAPPPGKAFRIGILSNVPVTDPAGAPLWGAFIQGLRDLGYVEGRNISIEDRSSEGRYERLPKLAAELVRLNVDVIVVPAPQNAMVVKQATRTIPIVVVAGGDVAESGLVESLARPGGNITGLTGMVGPEIVGKRVELLKETFPRLSRLAVLWNPTNESSAPYLTRTKAAAQSLGAQLRMVEARGPDDLGPAFAAMDRQRAEAVIVIPDGMFLRHRARLAALAIERKLPTIFAGKDHVEAGGLMSYSPSLRDGFYRAAGYVDRIFNGARPADMPIERPTKFELVINLKTAKAIGVEIPRTMILRADEVIQ